jgi:uncharacterized protein (DUF1800 family)
MPSLDPLVALRRFGLGARSGDVRRVSADPRGFVLGALADKSKALLNHPDLDPSHVVFANVQDLQLTKRLTAQLAKSTAAAASTPATRMAAADPNKPPVPAMPMDGGVQPAAPPAPQKPKPQVPELTPNRMRRDAMLEEASRRVERAVATDVPFLERLVMFWSNHFCVAANKGQVRGLAGGFEREAIRPHVLGRFADMLRAVEKHPAMLIYLDNQLSTGPNSRAGKGQKKGLNENLAREILELHTLGVDGGYGQEDVTNFARVLTGWQVGQQNIQASETGKFYFAPNRHEPGAWAVVGRRYDDEGQRTGERVLDDLARHPATARYIATRIARHFVSETPPPGLVAALEKTFRDSDGDLEMVSKTLVTHPESWNTKPAKVVPPYDFVVSITRGFGISAKPQELLRLAGALGQPLWTPPSPKGWPDDDEAWTGPSAITERLRIAEKAARELAPPPKPVKPGAAGPGSGSPVPGLPSVLGDPREAADDLLGPGLSDATRTAIARAETREQGFELLMMAPEFLRR